MVNSRLTMVGRRLLQAVPSVFGIIIVTFLLTRALPGDPAAFFAGPAADEKSLAEIRAQLGLDKNLAEQFLIYLGDLATGDLGTSLNTGQPVVTELIERLPASLELTFYALIMCIGVALPLGIMAALRENSWIDHVCRVVVTAGVSLPTFFTGLFLIYIFYYLLGFAPSPLGRISFIVTPPPHVTGFYTFDALIIGDFEAFWAAFTQLLLPSITMGIFALAPIARMTRGAMVNILGSDFVRTVKAAGLPSRKIVIVYALRNAILPVITTMGMVFSFMLGTNVLVEKVFAWPGVGSFAVEALIASDYAAVQGFVLSMAILFVLLNLIVDILYTLADPRMGIDS